MNLFSQNKWEKTHTHIQDTVEIGKEIQHYHDKTIEWLNKIQAKIIEKNKTTIKAKHITITSGFDFGQILHWQKIIDIKFLDNNEDKKIYIEISRAPDYRDYVFDPYVYWRELVLEYYDFIGIKIDDQHKKRLFNVEYMLTLLNDRRKERLYVFFMMVILFAFSILMLIRGFLRLYFISLLAFLFVGGVFGGVHTAYLDVKKYTTRLM